MAPDGRSASADVRRPVSLHDVAREAGVHSSTASRALTGATDRPVNPQTRERVIDAAKRLGYQPNAMARSLKTNSAGAIGMLVPSLRNPFWSQMMRAVVRRASERDLVVLLAEDTGDEGTEKAYERLVAQARIDGLIVTSASERSSLPARVIASGAPCVFAGRGYAGAHGNVRLAEECVSQMAVEHFAELGHALIGHVTGPVDASDIIERRVTGFLAAAKAHGVAARIERGSLSEAGGSAATERLLAGDRRPSAIFVTNFNQVFGVLSAIRARGLEIPDDVSVIAADDDPVFDYLSPPQTAMRRDHDELGTAAVDALLEQMAGSPARDIELSSAPSLIVRASTAPPPTAAPGEGREHRALG
jgi:LacI family transcriptional regulator, galactose operon repressor